MIDLLITIDARGKEIVVEWDARMILGCHTIETDTFLETLTNRNPVRLVPS